MPGKLINFACPQTGRRQLKTTHLEPLRATDLSTPYRTAQATAVLDQGDRGTEWGWSPHTPSQTQIVLCVVCLARTSWGVGGPVFKPPPGLVWDEVTPRSGDVHLTSQLADCPAHT